ncbi:right-handed parallel beta-helix repeat-containing protein [Longispora urticae]
MRRHHLLGLAMATLTTATSLVTTAPAHAAVDHTYIYVNNTNEYYRCSDTGTGDVDHPLCTLTAGMAATANGGHLTVTGTFEENVTVSRSGTPENPFRVSTSGTAQIRGGITIAGRHDVSISFFHVSPYDTRAAVTVSDSTRIRMDYLRVKPVYGTGLRMTGVTDSAVNNLEVGSYADPGIDMDATTSGVTVTSAQVFTDSAGNDVGIRVLGAGNTVTRSQVIGARRSAILLGAGASNTVVSSNLVTGTVRDSVAVDNAGATGTAITNNTVTGTCAAGVRVSGASSGVSVQNNVVSVRSASGCDPAKAAGIGVYDAAVSGTTVDHNTVTAAAGAKPYAWTNPVATLAAFRTVSGQGAHDSDSTGPSVNVDSANSAAPGFPARDYWNQARQDNPGVPNSGVGPVGYGDRGALEDVRGPEARLVLSSPDGGDTVTADASGTTAGWAATASYRFVFDDGYEVTQAGPIVSHPYPGRPRRLTVRVVVTDVNGMSSQETQEFQPGDGFTPVDPVRVLDTRERIGVGTTTPVAPGGVARIQVNGRNGLPATGVTAVTMNVTVTAPTAPGFLMVEPAGGWTFNSSSNLNWVAGQTVPNLVVVAVIDGFVDFRNRSAGTVHVVADLVGFHSPTKASRYTATSPVRVLDTRERIGVGTTTPVAPGGTVTLPVAGVGGVPTGITAVTLNVTATEPAGHGFLTVYPDGRPRPNASNLNWTPGLTVPNLVVVPVVNGRVAFRNTSPGTVHVVADLVGYHTSGVGSAFHTSEPRRLLDTRAAVGHAGTTPVAPYSWVDLDLYPLIPEFGRLSGVVLNVTVTEPTANGFLTVYPGTEPARPNASNLNWRPGQTVPNLVIVPSGAHTVRLFNSSPGTVHVVADLYGYYTG